MLNILDKKPKKQCKIIAITNQKGGVGKTTTCVNLAAALAIVGKKVLLIDMDAQGNATTALGLEKNGQKINSYDFINGVSDDYQITDIENLFCISSSQNLSALDIELAAKENREYFLKNQLTHLQSKIFDEQQCNFDYIFIDCPPALNIVTINVFVAADSVIIPVQCEFYSLEGIAQLLETINIIKNNLNENLQIEGIVMTMFDKRNILANNVIQNVRQHFEDYLYHSVIPRNVRLSEAPSFGKPAIIYDVHCSGSKAYLSLAKEFLENQK